MMDRSTMEAARRDAGVFAEVLIGEVLWSHQLEVARSDARVRCMCTGRQSGKSRTMAVCALHEAFRAPNRRVLILSAGEDAARQLLAECAMLATASPLLSGSVIDESKAELVLSNGSLIRSVPASEKQVRGRAVDLLILDEACFIEDALWTAARFTVIARPGSRVLMASTPWGREDRFFAVAFRAGERGEAGFASFRWPSTASPLVDEELLELWRRTSTDREYRREVLAEWVDDAGAYFTAAELDAAVDDYDMIDPADAHGLPGVGGVDWGFAHDASTLAILSIDENETHPDGPVLFVAWLEEAFATPYAQFIDRLVEAVRPCGYALDKFVSEVNGVGAMPTQELARRVRVPVAGVHTDARSKETGFGTIKLLMQQGRFFLPRHPALLRQLSALEFADRDGGVMHIAVPERSGHDDLAMALCLAMHPESGIVRPRRKLKYRGAR